MAIKKWTNEEITFLKENYIKYGNKFCSKKLDRTESSIEHKVIRIGISGFRKGINTQLKPFEDYKFNANHFLEVREPIIAYFLGLLWADGHIEKNSNKIEIKADKNDIEEILPHLEKFGVILKRCFKNKNLIKEMISVVICNPYIHKFLKDNDYNIKSGTSAEKILNNIPQELKHYFFRGLSDGDGCFYYNNKLRIFNYSIASCYNQNWFYVEQIFKKLEINYTINRTKKQKSTSSIIYICNKKHMTIWGDYIYQNYENDKIGFTRKYNKYSEIKKIYESPKYLPEVYNTQTFIIKSNIIHNNKYEYPNVFYIKSHMKVEITCTKDNHGTFFQQPYSHLNGRGCPKCAIEKRKQNKLK